METGVNDGQSKGTEMALQSAIPVNFEAFFPRGAFVVGEVEPVVKWSDDGQRQGQDLDKVTGHPLWQVRVIDADPDATLQSWGFESKHRTRDLADDWESRPNSFEVVEYAFLIDLIDEDAYQRIFECAERTRKG